MPVLVTVPRRAFLLNVSYLFDEITPKESRLSMEAVIFVGLQASGKSSFYIERFFASHVRISLDLLKTRHRELRLLELCIATQQPFVVDNTNPTRAARSRYIDIARAAGFSISGFYFRSKVDDCLARNRSRTQQIPEIGLLATAKKMQRPSLDEGFDVLNYVRLEQSTFVIQDWIDPEIPV